MKKLLFIYYVATLLLSCSSKSEHNISGTLTDIANDTIILYAHGLSNDGTWFEVTIDTIQLIDDKFSIHLPDSIVVAVLIAEKSSSMITPAMSMRMRPMEFFLLPNEKVQVLGSPKDYRITGGAFYTELNELEKKYKHLQVRIDTIFDQCIELERSGVPLDSIFNEVTRKGIYTALYDSIVNCKIDYIKANPDKLSSLYLMENLMRDLPIKQVKDMLDLFSNEVKTGVLAPLHKRLSTICEQITENELAKANLQPGMPGPDFTLNTPEDKPFTLSSLKGKYVVLDFWGSWCGWCIKEFPEMKELYAKYKSKIEFVGINCEDTDEKWREAIQKNALPWINVYNTKKNNVISLYAVSGFPTKYILDKNGNILKRIEGEDPAFYTFIDDLMKK